MKPQPMLIALALLALAAPVRGQNGFSARTAVLFERYSFDEGLSFSDVSELSVPVTATWRFGRGDLTVSSGYARVTVTNGPSEPGVSPELSGVLDTQARLSLSLVPERLMLLLTGTAPTGMGTVDVDDVAVLRTLATDVVGFAAPSLGTGGSVGGGLVAAFPLGAMALGVAGRYSRPLSYTPVLGLSSDLRPGAEFRLRAGLEGAVGPRTYLRLAGIFARRGRDEFAGVMTNGIGNRYTGYLSIDQGIGAAALTFYAFDLFRAGPQVEQTALGAALFPRGNVIGAGAQLSFAIGPDTRLTPKAEFRGSWEAPDAETTTLERKGTALRFGADLRHQLDATFALAVQAEGLTGDVVESAQEIGMRGFRIAAYLEIAR